MGIPKFFRWLTRRYPLILQNVQREDEILPIDNLYLDLNGIVHNCVHGNDPKRHERISRLEDMEELWAAIMKAIDEIVHLVKPKKNVFLAVDGVAPRAKMNQQRARRFKSARERALLKAQIEARGKQMPDLFDSNAISPGTKFMSDLCKQLHFFIKYKLNSDPLYQNLESCVLSDGAVPGEGEHKMLDYIRQLRKKPSYDPNTRHMFYGADADLIMLSLLTHEPHFTIIREEHVVKRNKTSGGVQRVELSHTNNFQLIHISLLREYMMLEYKQLNGQLRFRFDIERIIDDFVFFCFFIGNDFLPSLSALDIAEGSLDHLIDSYKSFLPGMTDYITEAGTIHWDRAEKFIELLGQHEQQVFQGRIDSINHGNNRRGNDFGKRGQAMQKTVTVSAEAQMLLEGDAMGGEGQPLERVTSQVQSLYRSAIYAKKVAKVRKYEINSGGKKYKKYLISKKFREDEAGKGKQIPKKEKEALSAKLQALYQKAQQAKTQETEGAQAATDADAEETKDEAKTGLELIEEIDESYFSDLRPEDIPDDCVSEPNMEALENDDTAADTAKSNLLTAQADIDARAEEENRKFIQDFVTMYAENPNAAKKKYYLDKVGFNIDEDAGVEKRRVMMKKYLEGLQWVLYYYYKGCTHWRWYYPFHYAPMISDLGINIVREFLGSKTVIREFEIDFNCPTNDRPYTPFQQLLCIMPLKSIHLLPKCYEEIARGDLIEYFPEDFPIDLNGKTVAWEALVLIPFADEALFLQKESDMFGVKAGQVFSEEENIRNNSSFTFFSYKFDLNTESKPLSSTLTSLRGLQADKTKLTLDTNYENVGTEAFAPRILAGVQLPSPGYPTFKTLGAIELKYNSVYVQKQEFKVAMVMVPQVIEETQPEELEKFLMKLTKQNKKDVFVDFPYQNEAFPMSFEDQFSVYTLFGDYYENKYTIQVGEQTRSEKEWQNHVNRIRFKLEDKGIHCPPDKVNVLASCYKVSDVNFNAEYDDQYFFKVYDDRSTILPLSLMMRTRSPEHHMSVDIRTLSPDDEIKLGSQVICVKLNMYGLLGTSVNRDRRSGNFKVKFDKEKESAKVHDPFIGQKAIEAYAKANAAEVTRSQQYYGETEIDTLLQVPEGVTAAMTSSFMVKYKSPETRDRVLVDIGLNIKSWKSKQHVPGFVRFAANQASVNAVDEIAGKNFQRAGRHVRAHWQYSVALVEILREYKEKFPEVFESALRVRKRDQMPGIKEVIGADDSNAVGRLKEITKWIESLPISSLPFVDMGFDTLETSMISSINDHRQNVEENEVVNLQVRANEYLPSKFLYMERFPYWSSLFPENTVDKFKVGDRVINLCSTKRAYVPFGARGTCVGKSEQKVIVMYDEQFIQGSDINGQCELYRGALMEPTHLMNVTRKFENQIKKNGNRVLSNLFTTGRQHPAGEEQPNQQAASSSGSASQRDSTRDNTGQSEQTATSEDASRAGPQMANSSQGQEESKGNRGQGGGRGQQKQYRMKSNQQQAFESQQQQTTLQEGRRVRGGRGAGGRGGRGREGGQRGGHQQQPAPAQNEPEEIPKLTFKPMGDLAELMNAVNFGAPGEQSGPSQMSSEAQPFQPPPQTMPADKAAQNQPNSSLMSQNMVSLESPAFVPTEQKPVPSNQAQGASTSNPEEQKPTDQQ